MKISSMNNEVLWWEPHIIKPKSKKPIVKSTKASSDIISLLSKDGSTINELYYKINYDEEAKTILKLYIDKGYGNMKASDLFKY